MDISRGELIVGKRYRKIYSSEVPKVMRRFADLVLEAYTGKPGIFFSKIVFVGREQKKSDKQIFISDFDGTNLEQITREKSPHLSPVWSPDGKFITYTSYEEGNPDLYIYELSSKKKRKLSGRKGINSGSNWSPAGDLIVFTGSDDGDADIFTLLPSGSGLKKLIRGSGLDVDPRFSPDKKYLAFVSGRYGNPHIFRAELQWENNLTPKIVGEKRLTYAGWYNATPAWTPDSQRIVFAGYDKDIDRFDLFLMNSDGTKLERLTIRAGDNESPDFSPNGQIVVFQSNRQGEKDIKGNPSLWMMNRDGSGQRKIEMPNLYEAQTPDWGPNLSE